MNTLGFRLLRLAVLATLVACARPAAAQSIPDSATSALDGVGVGDNLGHALGEPGSPGFDVIVRDQLNHPVLGVTVWLDFSATSVRAYAVQNAGTTVNAAARRLTRVGTLGAVNFAARTGGHDNAGQVFVLANGVVLGNARWRSLDIDGADGTIGLGDFTHFVGRFFAQAPAPECNFDLSNSDIPDLADFNLLAAEALAAPPAGAYAW